MTDGLAVKLAGSALIDLERHTDLTQGHFARIAEANNRAVAFRESLQFGSNDFIAFTGKQG